MGNIRTVIKENTAFLIPCVLFWVAGCWAIGVWGKVSLQVLLNRWHTPFQDELWVRVTSMGEFGFLTCIVLAGGLFSYRFLIAGAAAVLLSSGLTTVIKHLFEVPRPSVVLAQMGLLDNTPLVSGITLHQALSFPSGHTTAAFCLFATLAFFARKGWIKFALFFPALAVAFSRIYLMQHFTTDVVAGSVIGTLAAVAVYAYARTARWMDFGRPLVSFFSRYGAPKESQAKTCRRSG